MVVVPRPLPRSQLGNGFVVKKKCILGSSGFSHSNLGLQNFSLASLLLYIFLFLLHGKFLFLSLLTQFFWYIDTSNFMTENSLRFLSVLFVHSAYLIRVYHQITVHNVYSTKDLPLNYCAFTSPKINPIYVIKLLAQFLVCFICLIFLSHFRDCFLS